MVGMIKQAKDVKERAFPAAGRAHHRVNSSGSNIKRNSTQRVHAGFILTQVAFDVATTQRKVRCHMLEPRRVTTGGKLAARRAGA